jgi:RNA polymerase sigma-70 factor (ECF subfamily)
VAGGERLTRSDLEALYRTQGPRLLLYLQRRTGDAALASDLVQEVFLRLLRVPIRATSEAEVKSYLYRIANSRLVDHARRTQRERGWKAWLFHEPITEPAAGSDFECVFRRLATRDATLLWLAYVEGMDHNEIAKALDVKRASVKVLLSRARGRLRDLLAEGGLAQEGLA